MKEWKLLKENDARKLIARKVPWVKGEMYNYTTFRRLVEEKLLPTVLHVNRGQHVFVEDDVLDLISKFPPEDPPRRIGIINWLKGKRPKKKAGK